VVVPRGLSGVIPSLFLLQVSGVEHHQPGQFARGGGGDDLPAKTALDQQRQATAVIEMGVGQEQEIDGGGFETERFRILLLEFASSLVEAAIDEYAATGALDEMTGAGDTAVRAME